jgi:hypothetical protein
MSQPHPAVSLLLDMFEGLLQSSYLVLFFIHLQLKMKKCSLFDDDENAALHGSWHHKKSHRYSLTQTTSFE